MSQWRAMYILSGSQICIQNLTCNKCWLRTRARAGTGTGPRTWRLGATDAPEGIIKLPIHFVTWDPPNNTIGKEAVQQSFLLCDSYSVVSCNSQTHALKNVRHLIRNQRGFEKVYSRGALLQQRNNPPSDECFSFYADSETQNAKTPFACFPFWCARVPRVTITAAPGIKWAGRYCDGGFNTSLFAEVGGKPCPLLWWRKSWLNCCC